MKRGMPILALVLSILMTAAGCSLVRINPERDAQVVLAQVGLVQITKGEFNTQWSQWKQQLGITEDIESSSEYAETINTFKGMLLDSMVEEEVIKQEAKKRGFFDFTAEQQAQIDEDFADIITSIRDSIKMSLAVGDLSDEEIEAKVDEELTAYRQENGYTDEYIRSGLETDMARSRLYEEITKGATADESALTDKYNTLVTSDQSTYASDADAYVNDYRNGTDIYFVPTGGMRIIQQILIALPDDVRTNIASLRAQGNDDDANAARDAALKDIADQSNEVLQELKDGGDFADLVQEYNEDPGMETLPEGYPVNSAVTTYSDEFTQGAMALGKVGDISDLIADDEGYHILRYADQLSEGAVDFDSVKEQVREAVLNDNKESLWSDAVEQWKSNLEITTYPKRID